MQRPARRGRDFVGFFNTQILCHVVAQSEFCFLFFSIGECMKSFFEKLENRRLLSATFYVAVGGSDSAAGSQTAPFATLQEAANQVVAGDTVIVEAGTYAGFSLSYENTQSGTAAAPIVFEADPSAAAGSVIINSENSKTPVAIDLEPGSDYVTIKGFSIENNGTVTKEGIKATGNNDSIIDNTVTGVGGFGIFTDNANNALIEGNTVTGTTGTNTTGHGSYAASSSKTIPSTATAGTASISTATPPKAASARSSTAPSKTISSTTTPATASTATASSIPSSPTMSSTATPTTAFHSTPATPASAARGMSSSTTPSTDRIPSSCRTTPPATCSSITS
jgi:hypothetical protein